MALRTLVARRFLSTSAFSSQLGAAASNLTAAGSAAPDKPAPVPSETLFVSGTYLLLLLTPSWLSFLCFHSCTCISSLYEINVLPVRFPGIYLNHQNKRFQVWILEKDVRGYAVFSFSWKLQEQIGTGTRWELSFISEFTSVQYAFYTHTHT